MLELGCHLIRHRKQHTLVFGVDEVYFASDGGTFAEFVVGDRGGKVAVGFLERVLIATTRELMATSVRSAGATFRQQS